MSGPSMSLVDKGPNVGVGNYKGVMLCNRPFGGSTAGLGKPAGPEKTSFTCGVVSETPGMNKYPKRKKKETALTKHRKWLAELQKTKDRLESQYEEEMKQTADTKEKFAQKEREMRLIAKSSKATLEPKTENAPSPAPAESKAVSKPKAKMPRPAWALTEEVAEAASDEKDMEDEDELISFAKNLDFDKYIDDLEVHTMMERVKARIAQLERETTADEMREIEAEERAIMRMAMEAKGEDKVSGDVAGYKVLSEADEARSAAKDILSEAADLKGIHSTKSVAAVYLSAKESKGDGESKVINQPKIVTHEESNGARMELRNNPSNLPYIHRNPAV